MALRLAVLCSALVLRLHDAAAADSGWGAWAQYASKAHILIGSIYETTTGKLTPPRGSDYGLTPAAAVVLIGEVHDNPDHHLVQAWIVENLVRAGAHPGVVFEQIRSDQQPALDDFAKRAGRVDDLLHALDWEKSGWPSGDIYKPLFGAVLQARLAMYPGNVTRESVRSVAKSGTDAVPPKERGRLQLDVPLAGNLRDALLTELEASHCGLMPKSAFGNLAAAQRYRDANLAEAVLQAASRHGAAVLIAGNGHVRSDRGVPWYLRRRSPETKVISIQLAEVEFDVSDPGAYVARGPDGRPAADFVVFTPRAERPDPCVAMRERFGQKK